MRRRAWLVGLLACGCASTDPALPVVADNPFHNADPAAALKAFHDPATEAVGLRVHTLGQKLLAANPDLPVKPAFQAVGSPQPEAFPKGTEVVYVSKGLVDRCANDAELAAVLSVQLGRMVSQRDAQATLRDRRDDRDLPTAFGVGGDAGGVFGPPDATHLAERAKYGETRRGRSAVPPLPADPQALARTYLARAGYTVRDLETVQPLLKEAARNSALEKTLGGATPVRPWQP